MLVESIQRRVEQKVSPRSDLALARSRAAQVRQQLATTKAERQSALMRVFQFVGDTSFDPGTVPIYEAAVSHPDPARAFDPPLAFRHSRTRLLTADEATHPTANMCQTSALAPTSLHGR